jgi:hypothetical protein
LINHASIVGPLFYPYWVDNGKELRIKLQKNRIFTPVYWQNVLMISNKDTTEFDLADNMVLLPIDQRYDFSDLDYVLNLI